VRFAMTLRKRWMALMLARGMRRYERLVADRKRALLGNLSGNILEIGPGTGANLRFYPPGIRWIGIEPNPFMHQYLTREAARLGLQAEIRTGTVEHLDLPDNSMDAAVSTLVLCSVPDLQAALGEIHRVLKPGGRFLFIEHVAAPAGTTLRRIQGWVKPFFRFFGDGCSPDRETWTTLENDGFARVTYERIRVPVPFVSPHIVGSAQK
jgi:ubiquinone/menaquinone biosynthesis C-methylase UbiE